MMNNLALGVSALIMSVAAVEAQPTSTPPAGACASTNVLGPRIQFATSLYDFGRVKAGEPVKYTYVFTNTGDRLLIINSVQPQCGCTTAGEWTRQAEPGKTGVIPIQFNTANYNSGVFKQVTVSCNITNQPVVFLQLKGTVYKPYEMMPPVAVLNIPPDAETVSGVVTITNHTEEPLWLSEPQSNNRAFAVDLKTNAPGKGYQLTISAVPPMPTGSVQGQISLHSTWTNTPIITVPVAANVMPAVMVIPSYMTLAPGPLNNPVTNSVSIQNRSTNSLTLSDPVVNVAGVQAEIKELLPGKSFAALLAFPQGFEVPRGQQIELSLKSSNPKFPVIKVPVLQMPRPARPPAQMTPAMRPRPTPVGNPPAPPPVPMGH